MGVRGRDCLFGVFGILLRGIGGVVGGSGRSLRSVCGRGFETRLVAHERRLLEIASILQRRRWRNIKTWGVISWRSGISRGWGDLALGGGGNFVFSIIMGDGIG